MRRVLGTAMASIALLATMAGPAAATTTIPVDCGAGADLQAAIDAASAGDTVLISGTCVGNFSALKVLTLDNVTVRDNAGRGIWVHFGCSLSMVGAMVSGNGSAGIVAGGTVDIRQSTVRNNGGTGIYTYAVMTLTDSTVSGNGAVGIANVSGLDGRGDLTVVGATISGNAGGGIENRYLLSITDSKVMDNTTTGYGGGIWNRSEYPNHLNFWGRLTMSDSKVMGNTAGIDGGGIYNSAPPSEFTLSNVKIRDNTPNDCVGC